MAVEASCAPRLASISYIATQVCIARAERDEPVRAAPEAAAAWLLQPQTSGSERQGRGGEPQPALRRK